MTLVRTGRYICDEECCEVVLDVQLSLDTASGDVYKRPMFELLSLSESGDTARWPEPYEHHDLDGVLFR